MDNEQEFQNQLLNTYQENMKLIQAMDEELFKKLSLLEEAISTNQYTPKYELEYIDGNFDLFIVENETYLYNKKSDENTKAKTDDVTIDNLRNNFNPYMQYEFTEDVMESIKNKGKYPTLDTIFPTTAPIMNYVNNNAPMRSELKKLYKFIFIGTGLGLHINPIDEKINASSYLIIEPDLEVFRLSLFVTDYYTIASKADLQFLISYTNNEFKYTLKKFSLKGIGRNNNWKFDMFSSNHKSIAKNIQDFIVGQDHLAYPFYVHFRDIKNTYEHWSKNFTFLNFRKKNYHFGLKNKPFLLVGAGPSLQKNIEILQQNQSKFIIIAAGSALNTLSNYNIKPDIAVQIDADEISKNVITGLDKEYIKDIIFLFGAIMPTSFASLVPKENLYMFQMRFAVNEKLGNLVGDSVGDLIYTMLLLLDIENIYLLGLDLALEPETNKVHSDGHALNMGQMDLNDEVKEGMNSSTHKSTTIKVKGNFRPFVNTIGLFKVAIDHVNKITKEFKEDSNNIYNLNDGAYFNYTIPMYPDEFKSKLSNFESFDKNILCSDIHKELSSISTNKLSSTSLETIYKKILHAQELQVIVSKFHSFTLPDTFDEYNVILNEFVKYMIKPGPVEDTEISVIIESYLRYVLHFIYEFFNKKDIDDEKKHLKNLHRMFSTAIENILDTYLQEIEQYYKALK